MKKLTDQNKKELICEVNIILQYSDCDDVKRRFSSLRKYLEEAGLQVTIAPGRRYGPCLDLICKGETSLASAELILSKEDDYILPLGIRYDYGRFVLVSE